MITSTAPPRIIIPMAPRRPGRRSHDAAVGVLGVEDLVFGGPDRRREPARLEIVADERLRTGEQKVAALPELRLD
jgi:hypothetical protein